VLDLEREEGEREEQWLAAYYSIKKRSERRSFRSRGSVMHITCAPRLRRSTVLVHISSVNWRKG